MAVIAVIVYIIFYSLGPGPIPLLVTAELFNTETRGKATSIAVFFNWFFSFIVSFTFPYIQVNIEHDLPHHTLTLEKMPGLGLGSQTHIQAKVHEKQIGGSQESDFIVYSHGL